MGTVMASNPKNKPVCVIIGVGSGNGAANAQKFSQEGYALALISRSMGFISELADQIEDSKAYTCDVIDTLIYSASSRFKAQGSKGNIEVATEEDMERAWRIDTLGCMASCKQVIPDVVEKGKGNIIILGATGSL